MQKIFYLLSVILFFTSCSESITYEEKISLYNSFYNQGDSLSKTNNYKDAILKLNEAIDITDTIGKALFLRGKCYQSIKQFEKADKDYSNVIDIEGKKSVAYKNRAINSFKLGEHDDFKDDIDNYILYHKHDANALILRADHYIFKENYENAISDFTTLIYLQPNNADFYLSRGNLFALLDKKSESITDYEKYILISNNKDNSEIYYKKGLLNFSSGKYSEAVNDFNHIESSFINFDIVLATRGESYFLLEQYKNSIIDFSNFLKIDQNNSKILEMRAEAFLMTGNRAKSFEDYQKSSSLFWQTSSILYKYSFIVIAIVILFFLYYFISLFSEKINDNNTPKRIYLYFLITGLFGGHYLALKLKTRYYIYVISLLLLIINNNYEIVSFYHNLDLFVYSLKLNLLNQILFFTVTGLLVVDFITITVLVNYSNYKFQQTISPQKSLSNGDELNEIEQSLISNNYDFNNLKEQYKI